MAWVYPLSSVLSDSTRVKLADNKIQAAMDDLVKYVNGTDEYEGAGLAQEGIDYLYAEISQIVEDTLVIEW